MLHLFIESIYTSSSYICIPYRASPELSREHFFDGLLPSALPCDQEFADIALSRPIILPPQSVGQTRGIYRCDPRDGFTTPVTSAFCCCRNQFEPVTVEFRRVIGNNDTTKTAVYWKLYSPIMSYWFHMYIYIYILLTSILYVYITFPDFLPQHITNIRTCSFRNFDRDGLVGLCHAMLLKRGLPFWKKHVRFELQLWCPGITPQNWNRRSPRRESFCGKSVSEWNSETVDVWKSFLLSEWPTYTLSGLHVDNRKNDVWTLY